MNLKGICKYESGPSVLKSRDSSFIQLLPAVGHGLKLEQFSTAPARGGHAHLLSQVTSQLEGDLKGNNQFCHFSVLSE